MKDWKKTTFNERQKIKDLFKEHLEYLDINILSENPYIQFPDGTIIYLKGVED